MAGVVVHLPGVGERTVYPVMGTVLADLMEAIYLASAVGVSVMCVRCLTTVESMKNAADVDELMKVMSRDVAGTFTARRDFCSAVNYGINGGSWYKQGCRFKSGALRRELLALDNTVPDDVKRFLFKKYGLHPSPCCFDEEEFLPLMLGWELAHRMPTDFLHAVSRGQWIALPERCTGCTYLALFLMGMCRCWRDAISARSSPCSCWR